MKHVEFDDIRVGDTVQRDWLGTTMRMTVARREGEGLIYSDGDFCAGEALDDKWYLLDRPTPPVELPTEPTYGVLSWISGPNTDNPEAACSQFAEWYLSPCVSGYSRSGPVAQVHAKNLGLQVPVGRVTAFVPATTVPTDALDALRDDVAGWLSVPDYNSIVGKFLRAVDAASEATS